MTWVDAVYRNSQVEDEIKNGESVSHAWGRPFVKIVSHGGGARDIGGERVIELRVMEGSILEGEKRGNKREQESKGQQKHEEKLRQGRIEFAFETLQNRQRPAVPASRQTLFKLAAVAWAILRHLTDSIDNGTRGMMKKTLSRALYVNGSSGLMF